MERSLSEALEYRGCPICYVLGKDEADFVATLQYQTVKQDEVREKVVSGGGYCNFHFYEMVRLASPMGNALLTRELIDVEIQKRARDPFGPISGLDCPVCKYVNGREAFYVMEFSTLLCEKSFQEEYEATDGLCRIHLERVLRSVPEGERRQFIVTSCLMHLRLLRVELETFIAKVRSTSRDFREEKNSWLVAIEKMVGKRGLKR